MACPQRSCLLRPWAGDFDKDGGGILCILTLLCTCRTDEGETGKDWTSRRSCSYTTYSRVLYGVYNNIYIILCVSFYVWGIIGDVCTVSIVHQVLCIRVTCSMPLHLYIHKRRIQIIASMLL